MNKKIIFSSGGTGGHIFPAVNLMKHYFEKGYEVLFITDQRGKNFLKNYPEFKSYVFKASTFTNKNIINRFLSLFVIGLSIIKAIFILKKEKPSLVFGFGGYVSFPICLASKIFNLPLIIYENNMILGRANKFLLPFSKKILLARIIEKNFPKNYKSKAFEVGEILSKNIIKKEYFKKIITEENLSILVLGGSQGAEIFGEIVPKAIKMIKENGISVEIKQQCTSKQIDIIKNFYEKNNIKNYVFEFEKDILKLISNTSLAITRCGASTTAELAYTQTPFIAVPLPNSIDNHQYLNAEYYEKKGCCWIIKQDNFNAENLFNLIQEIVKNKKKLKSISENIQNIYKRNVYTNIEKEIKEFI